MPEKISISPENIKKPSEISKKTRKLIQAFSLSIWVALWVNAYTGETGIQKQPEWASQEQKDISSDGIYKELTYLFTEKNDWLIAAITRKMNDENLDTWWDLGFIQEDIINFFHYSIEKNGLDLEFTLNREVIDLLRPIKFHLKILFDLRYGRWVYNIFDGKNYEQSRIKIIFKKVENNYIIESIHIFSMEESDLRHETNEIFYENNT